MQIVLKLMQVHAFLTLLELKRMFILNSEMTISHHNYTIQRNITRYIVECSRP